ncbi:hypothetical protein Y032_0715g1775 [Ancylostoma ceylanicum]|uniref:Mos1 transposase HTH domain-containing protein n=1 Tax=Ancylostoma ceylanicum TaxID=53326 RepID=A0A016WFT0_9BILA|nr:hypothetical protein Y032_0715g1775 [Ancylostoma ceylanicum]
MNSVEESAAEATQNIIKVFGKGAASERTICRWFKKFHSGDFNLENEPRGRTEVKSNLYGGCDSIGTGCGCLLFALTEEVFV